MEKRALLRFAMLYLAIAAALPAPALAEQKASRSGRGARGVVRRFDPKKPPLDSGHLLTIKSDEAVTEYHFQKNGSYNTGRTGTDWQHMSLGQYQEIRNAGIELMKKFPPATHVYVGIGRDPAPFIAFMEELGAEAFNFPASGTGWQGNATLDEHIEKILPARVRNGNKTIVLVDQTSSGKSLAAAMPIFSGFLQRTGGTAPVKALAFTGSTQLNSDAQREGVETISTDHFPEVNRFFYAPYEGVVSPYARHNPATQRYDQIQWRPQYGEFKAALGQRIERDGELDTFLKGLSAGAGSRSATAP
jgi:hypothetical protein